MRPFLRTTAALAATALLALGCGSGGSTTTNTGSITLSISPGSASIQQGGTAQVTGTIVRTDFTGDVTVTVTGAPSGVTGTATEQPVSGGNTARVTLSAGLSTAPGTYTLTVTASGSGISSVSQTFTLTITAAPSSFGFVVNPSAPSLAQGASLQLTGTVTRNNFSGDIAITVTGAPTGVTANVTASPVNGGNSALITVAAASTAAPGQYTLTVTANGGGASLTVIQTVQLTISVTGSFSIAAGTGTLNVTQGNNITTGINATRVGGFAGTIVYTVTGPAGAALPTGLTAAVTPTATADQNTLTVTTTTGLAPATYPLVVHGAAFGSDQTANVSVVVAAAGSGVRLDFSQCVATSMPIWLAYQDGSGAFTRVTGSGNVYTFTITAAQGAVASVAQNGSQFVTTVAYYSRAELAALGNMCGTAGTTGSTINGSVSGLTTTNNGVQIGFGGAIAFANLPSPNFQLTNVLPGMQDLIAYERINHPDPSASDLIIIRRDLNLANGSTITPVLNFQSAEPVPVATASVNVSGAALNSFFASMSYLMGTSCASNQIDFNTAGVAAPLTIYGVPAASQRPTDYHNLTLQQINGQADLRSVSTSFHALGAKTVAMGAGIGTVTTSVLAGSFERLQAAFTLAADYNSASLSYFTTGPTRFMMTQSAGYLGGSTAVTLTPPDLTTVPGFLATWGPAIGTPGYTVTATSAFPATMCAEGATFRTASSGVGGA